MDEIKPLLVLIISSLLIRQALIATNQNWAKSHSQTVSFFLLPIITYIITNTIKGNIALSLGMIGALSIVRFRHPVKSALELILYFDLITLGIAMSVRTKWAIQLTLVTVFLILTIYYINLFFKKYGKTFYSLSFNEGVSLNSLEIVATKPILLIEEHKNLKNFYFDKDLNEYIYKLTFVSSKDLLNFKKKLDNINEIKKTSYDLI